MKSLDAPLHILSAEYPPRIGGVSDHVAQISAGIAATGREVHVWSGGEEESHGTDDGVNVHRVRKAFSSAGLKRIGVLLDDAPSPKRILLQWVPQSFGYRGLNVGLCLWLLSRSRKGDQVEIMVHEPWMPFSGSHPSWNVYAAVHRVMTTVLIRAAAVVWVSAPQWAEMWAPYRFGKSVPFAWLPLPTGIPVEAATEPAEKVAEAPTVGYFGLVPSGSAGILRRWIESVLDANEGVGVLLIGKGSREFARSLGEAAEAPGRISATGTLDARDASLALQRCDVLIQPYAGGANARRSSLVTALAHGLPIVTTRGEFTEPLWSERRAVVLVEEDDAEAAATEVRRLLADQAVREGLGRQARAFYEDAFRLEIAVGLLTGERPLVPLGRFR